MLELEKLGLVEMNSQEVQEIDGGFIPLLIIGACLLLSGCAATKPIPEHSHKHADGTCTQKH